MKVKCKHCGKEFETVRRVRYCSDACRETAAKDRELKWRNEHPESVKAASQKQASEKRGDRKPKGMSDVRWRIEQRRRQCPSYYRNFGEFVPPPRICYR